MNRFTHSGIQRRQQGASLFAAMIFLIVLSLLAIVSIRGVIMQERMAGNTQDWNLAFQSAEAALRNAEAEIQIATSRIQGNDNFTAYPDCTQGRCQPSATGVTVWDQMVADGNTDWLGTTHTNPGTNSVIYGAFPPASAPQPEFPDVSVQPRYFIENLGVVGSTSLAVSGYGRAAPQYYGYRITAVGFGLIQNSDGSPATRVVLQSVYQR